MISFPTAPRVTPGELVRASHASLLADACNSRLRSGIADGVARIGYYVRNSLLAVDVGKPQASFLTDRQFAPDTEPMPIGATNAGSNLPDFVHGNEAGGLQSERDRLLAFPLVTPADPRGYWDLGVEQRGGWDPESGAVSSPSFTAARAYAAIRWRWWSPQGSSWGGYQPSPTVLSACEDPDTSDDAPPPRNLELKLHSLRDGYPDITFPGTCEDGPDISTPGMYDLHVAAWGNAPWAYYVLLNNGTLTEYSKAHYVEGPYRSDPRVRRAWGNHMERMFARYAAEFRGVRQNEKAPSGRPGNWCKRAFGFRDFLRSQYLLAPARASTMGDSLLPHYPEVRVSTRASGPLEPADDCAFAAAIIEGENLTRPTTVEALDGDTVIAAVSVTRDSPARTMRFHPCPSKLSFQCTEDVGSIKATVAELMQYKPAPWDWFLVLRVSGMYGQA